MAEITGAGDGAFRAATPGMMGLTAGQVVERLDTTVRSLHHYDEIGLPVPSQRSAAGYRLYNDADLLRLQHVVVYRRLGFALEDIAALLDDPDADVVAHLRRQRIAVSTRRSEMRDLVAAIDRAIHANAGHTARGRSFLVPGRRQPGTRALGRLRWECRAGEVDPRPPGARRATVRLARAPAQYQP